MPPIKNETFSHQQNIWIVTSYREFKSPTALRREFCKHFKLSPHSYAFSRAINRFMAIGDVSPSNLPGPLQRLIEGQQALSICYIPKVSFALQLLVIIFNYNSVHIPLRKWYSGHMIYIVHTHTWYTVNSTLGAQCTWYVVHSAHGTQYT